MEDPALLWSYRRMSKLALPALLLLCVIFASAQDKSSNHENLISEMKLIAVSTLDPALPSIPFEQWLRTEAGADARFAWEVNDCGEQTGSPGQNPSEIPTCVEADAWLKDGRQIVIMIATPQAAHGKEGEQKPVVFFAQLISTREKITLKQLSDLPAALVRTHEPHKNPEIAK